MTEASSVEDPKGLIREAYRIDGITGAECRSIFLDWALSIPVGANQKALITALLDRYGSDTKHPMSIVLQEGLAAVPATGRRGGRAARVGRQT